METTPIETLPLNLLSEVQSYFQAHPSSPAARVRPLIGREGEKWLALQRDALGHRAVSGTGWSLSAALESFEANYREVTQAQQ